MTKKDFLSEIATCNVDQERVSKIEKVYNNTLPGTVKLLISFSEESVFFDDGCRTLSFSEIVDAEKDLHVNFVKLGILPLFDCNENDFIVYHFDEKNWSKYNIVDECSFKEKDTLDELL